MSSKEEYCYRILKSYSLIVDFDGTPDRVNVPAPVEGETYGQWKKRILGEDIHNVVLYSPAKPANQTKIGTLQNQAGAEHLEKMFKSLEKIKNKQKIVAVNAAEEDTKLKLTTFPRQTLVELVDDYREDLEPSVKECIGRFLNSGDINIDTYQLVNELLQRYNVAVRKFRENNK
jgi:hypothetical protein